MGDLWLSPYRIYAPRRINSRLACASFAKRDVEERDIEWLSGLPVATPERTLVDLCLDGEDPSLVDDALEDALCAGGLDVRRLLELLAAQPRKASTAALLDHLSGTLKSLKEAR